MRWICLEAVGGLRCRGSFPEGQVSISRGSAGRMKRMLNALESGTVMLEEKEGAWRKLGEDEVMHD